MKINILIEDMTKTDDGWTVSVSEDEAEEIKLTLESWRHKVFATYFKKEKRLNVNLTNNCPAGLFSEPPYKSGEQKLCVKAIEKELNKYERLPKSVNVSVKQVVEITL